MLRDSFLNLFRHLPADPDTWRIDTLEHADEIRGIRTEDASDDHAMTAAAGTLPDPFERQARDEDTAYALEQAIHELYNMQQTTHGVQRAEDVPEVQDRYITLSDLPAPVIENPYGRTTTYDTMLYSPIIDRAESNARCRRELDTLIQAIANMVSKRQQAFLRGTHTREDPLDDYGAELVRIFAEEEPHIYEQAMRSGSELAQTAITTNS